LRSGFGRDGSETFDHRVEFEAAVEAVFVSSQIARGVFGTTGAAGAGDGAFDVAEAGIDPFEFGQRGPSAACDNSLVFHPRLGHGGKTGKAIAGDVRAGLDILHGVCLDRLAGEARDAPQLRIDGLVLTRLDSDD
jgi:hypothetical protein